MIENWLSSYFSQMHSIGAKLIADALSEAGHDIAIASDLYTHLQQHHAAPNNYYQNFCIK